jgi:hypothetical protein
LAQAAPPANEIMRRTQRIIEREGPQDHHRYELAADFAELHRDYGGAN